MPTIPSAPPKYNRRTIRLNGYDYSAAGYYFVTIVSHLRHTLFGHIVENEMILNHAGQMLQEIWTTLPDRFPGIDTDIFQIMPNHIHGIIILPDDHPGNPTGSTAAYPESAPLLGDIVGVFKSMTTVLYTRGVKEAGWEGFEKRLWQRNYYEHIIRNQLDYERIAEYIIDNPTNWAKDEENPHAAPSPHP